MLYEVITVLTLSISPTCIPPKKAAPTILCMILATYRLTMIIIAFLSVSCDKVENVINGNEDGKITAKEKLDDVLSTATADFSADAKLVITSYSIHYTKLYEKEIVL